MRLLLALVFALVPVAAASAATIEPCLPGTEAPLCHVTTGTVTHVADGDTLDVDLDEDLTPVTSRVRITGINAMEQTIYSHDRERRRGECHALEATARLEQLVYASGGRIRLLAQDLDSRSGHRQRLRRAVQVLIGDRWQDAGGILLSEGHALWLPNRREWAWNRGYSALAQQAARAGVGLWSTEHCGPGPAAALRLTVRVDAEGSDAANPGGEWIRIRNLDLGAPVALGGWWLRDSANRRFVLPPETVLGPGRTLAVHVGSAPPGALGWNLDRPIFENPSDDERALGDGAYLFDPHGDLRAWMMVPCRDGCSDPTGGAIELRFPSGAVRDSVLVRNRSDAPVDLSGMALTVDGRTQILGEDAVVAAQGVLVVWALRDGRGIARLRTLDGIAVACGGWGGATC